VPRVSHLNYPVAYSCNSINTPDTETSFLSPAPALYDFALVQINYYLCANLRGYLSAPAYHTHPFVIKFAIEMLRTSTEQVGAGGWRSHFKSSFPPPHVCLPLCERQARDELFLIQPQPCRRSPASAYRLPEGGNAITSTASAVSRPLVPSSDARCQTRSSFDTGLCQGRHHSPTPLDPVPRLAIPVRQLLYPPSSLTTVRTA
jgi:hypothetical protein